MEDLTRRGGMLASSFEELGARMRLLRLEKHLSLEQMAARAPRDASLSPTTLLRHEKGQPPRPRLSNAAALDRMYAANGWVRLSIGQLWSAEWSPWLEGSWPNSVHICSWPAQLEADVWIRVMPTPEGVLKEHAFILRWGSWRRQHTTVLSEAGEFLVTGKTKDADGHASGLRVVCADQMVYMLHGAGPPPPDVAPIVEIHTGWELDET